MTTPSDKIVVYCTSCGKGYRLPRSSIGKSAKCKCGNRFVVEEKANDALPPLPSPPAASNHGPTSPLTPVSPALGPPLTPINNQPMAPAPLPSAVGPELPRLTPITPDPVDNVVEAIAIDENLVAPTLTPQPPINPLQPYPSNNIVEGLDSFQPSAPQTYGNSQPHGALTPATIHVNPYGSPTQTQPPGLGSTAGHYVGPSGHCDQHPSAIIAGNCTICHVPLCRTCLFAFPPNVICCPKCASETSFPISQHRDWMIKASMGCAVFGSIFMALVVSGVLAPVIGNLIGGSIAYTLATLPFTVGFGTAAGSYNKAEGNPPMLWGGAIWNGLGVIGPCAFFTLNILTSFIL